MLKKKIKYTDFDGVEREENFYFNLTKAELLELNIKTPGGFINKVERLQSEQDSAEIYKTFKEIVLSAYGKKSDDGRRFIKSKELSKEFSETGAFDELIMEFFTDAEAAAKFISAIVPEVPNADEKSIPMNNA